MTALMCKRIGTSAVLLAIALIAGERSAYADLCINADNGVSYRLQIGNGTPVAGTPLVVSGFRQVSTLRAGVVGTLFVLGNNAFISIQEMYDFGSGFYSHPNGTTVFTFPLQPGGNLRYDTTFHGNGALHNVIGGFSTPTCPAAGAAVNEVAAADPNRKEQK